MPQLNIEQQRAVAIAAARLRLQQQAPPTSTQPSPQPAAPPPEPLPTKAWPMSLGEAVKRYATGGIPNVLFGAATAEPNVQSELMKERVEGVPEAVTGIPDMMRSLAPIFRPLLAGIGGMPPSAEDIRAVGPAVKGVAKGVVDQVRIPAQGAAALIAPESVPAPSDEEFRQHARGQGNALGGAVIGLGAKPVIGKVSKYIREAPVRKGYTTINPETLKPEPAIPPIKVEMGKRIPKDAAPGAIFETHSAAQTAAKALGGDASDELRKSLESSFSRAFPDLIDAVQKNSHLRGPIDTAERGGAAASWARNRIWRDNYAPAFKEAGPVALDPVADKLIAKIPVSWQKTDKAKAVRVAKAINRQFRGVTATSEELHRIVRDAKADIQTAIGKSNPFDRRAALETPEGQMAEAYYDVLREHLYDHVKDKTKVDLRPIGDVYGALSELEQEFLGMAPPRSLLEELFTTYTFPTPRAMAARAGERIGKHMLSDPKQLERAFKQYAREFAEKPTERAKVTQPFWVQRSTAAAPQQPPKP